MRRADYEGRVLRSVYLYPDENLPVVINSLKPENFTSDEYRRAFKIIMDLARETTRPDTTLIADEFESQNFEPDIILNAWGSHYTQDSIQEPIREIIRRSKLQAINKLHKKWSQESEKVDLKVDQHIASVMNELYTLRVDDHVEATATSRVNELETAWPQYAGKQRYGVTLGLDKLDFITMGCQTKRLWLIGGYTSVGKSWLGVKIVNAHIDNKVPVLWLTFEMSAEELWWRLAVQRTARMAITLNNAKQKNLSTEDMVTFKKTLDELRPAAVYTVDHLARWDEAKLAISYYIYAHKIKCVVIDYVQNIVNSHSTSEYDALNEIIRDLQRIAVTNDVFICAFSQMNRESVREDEEYVFGFKGSGNLENAADVAMIYKAGSSNRDDPRRKLIVGKNRTGSTGEVFLYTNYAYGYIAEATEEAWKQWTPKI